MSILLKLVSAMEKCFMDEPFSSKKRRPARPHCSAKRCALKPPIPPTTPQNPRRLGSPSPYLPPSQSSSASVRLNRFLSDTPLIPRPTTTSSAKLPVFTPTFSATSHRVIPSSLHTASLKSLFVTVKIPENLPGGDYPVTLTLKRGEETAAEATYTVHVIEKVLPKQKMIVTEWFHTDCIANYYDLETFSEQHWDHIEKFMRTAVENGINTILTPVFTPPLDTAVGGERRTVQCSSTCTARTESTLSALISSRDG